MTGREAREAVSGAGPDLRPGRPVTTRVSVYAERVIEAGWLVALIATPLFFNVHAAEAFELTKATTLRSIAVVVGAAWLIRAVERGDVVPGRPLAPRVAALWRWVRSTPVVLPTALLLAASVLSTLASVAPRLSVWGSYYRAQGIYTSVAYAILFFSILRLLRSRDQVDRLLTTVSLVSLPVSLYAILQGHGLDPIPWAEGGTAVRVPSSLGNPIFLGGFLVMCVPVTLARLMGALAAPSREVRPSRPRLLPAAGHGAVLAVQLAALIYTQSRGPWLGLLAGLYLFGLLGLVVLSDASRDRVRLGGRETARAAAFALASLPVAVVPAFAVAVALKRGLRWLWLSWMLAGVLAAGGILALNVAPAAGVARAVPYLDRLSHLLETERGTGRFRVLLWQGATRLALPHEPLWSPGTGSDRLNPLRPIVGYGPETIRLVYSPFYAPELGHLEAPENRPDRAHNAILDSLAELGLVGLAAYLALVTSVVYVGLKGLGLVATPAARAGLLAVWLASGGLAVLIARALDGSWRYVGVALPGGMLLGLAGYIATHALRRRAVEPAAPGGPDALVVLGLLSAIVAHFVETQLGIAVTATRTYFWVFAALLIVVAGLSAQPGAPPRGARADAPAGDREPRARPPAGRRGSRRAAPVDRGAEPVGGVGQTLARALLLAFVLITLSCDFVPLVSTARLDALVGWVFVPTALLGGVLAIVQPARPRLARVALGILAGLGLSLGVSASVVTWWSAPANLLAVYYVAGFVTMVGLGVVMAGPDAPAGPIVRWRRAWPHAVVLVAVVPVVVLTNFRVIEADVSHNTGRAYAERGRLDLAVPAYEKALELAPSQDMYHRFLGQALVEQVVRQDPRATEDPAERARRLLWRAAWLQRAEEAFRRARVLSPLDPEHTAVLARFHQIRALRALDERERQEQSALSLALYDEATRLAPTLPHLYAEWGQSFALTGRLDEAIARFRQAIALDAVFVPGYVGLRDAHLARARLARDEAARLADLARADEADRKALELSRK